MNTKANIYVTNKNGLKSLNPKIVFIIALACGITVANLYWAQPLLDSISNSFNSTTAAAGLIVTLTQIGYAAGLVLIVPLGDVLERRRLIVSV